MLVNIYKIYVGETCYLRNTILYLMNQRERERDVQIRIKFSTTTRTFRSTTFVIVEREQKLSLIPEVMETAVAYNAISRWLWRSSAVEATRSALSLIKQFTIQDHFIF